MAEEEIPDPHVHGIAFSLPLGSGQDFEGQRDRAKMESAERRIRVHNLLDSLDPDQLRTLRLCLAQDEAGLHFLDGLVAGHLRLRHGVDPDSGEPLLVP